MEKKLEITWKEVRCLFDGGVYGLIGACFNRTLGMTGKLGASMYWCL